MEKVKKIILVILLISALTITVQAELLETINNPPNIMFGLQQHIYGTTPKWRFTVAPYPYDYGAIHTTQTEGQGFSGIGPVLLLWQSRYYADTYYKLTIKMEIHNSEGEELETGTLKVSNGTQFLTILEDSLFSSIDALQVGVSQRTEIDMQEFLDENMYSMFYDATSNMLSAIMYFPQSYFDANPEKQQHSYIMIKLGYPVVESNTTYTIDQYSGANAEGIYTDVLKEISKKLEMMASASGGLTEEQVNQAIQDALNAHDQQLEQEVGSKLNQILEQIGGVTEPYKQAVDQITGTLANVSNIFAYSGTDAVLTLPAAVNPLAGNAVLWQAQQIDLGAAYNTMPSSLRILLQYALRAAVLLAVVNEVINIIKYAIIGRGDRVD